MLVVFYIVFNVEIFSKLPHVLYTPDDTVCLFTKAEKKEALKLLEARGVTAITKVTVTNSTRTFIEYMYLGNSHHQITEEIQIL